MTSNKEILKSRLAAFDMANIISEDGLLYEAILSAMEYARKDEANEIYESQTIDIEHTEVK